MDKQVYNAFDKIEPDENAYERMRCNVMAYLVKPIPKPRRVKKVMILAAVLVSVAVLTAAATVIPQVHKAEKPFESWSPQILIETENRVLKLDSSMGLIPIKPDAPMDGSKVGALSVKQAEDLVGIHLLRSAMYESEALLNYQPIVSDKTIERVDFWHPACVVYSDYKSTIEDGLKEISGFYTLLTNKATRDADPRWELDASGGIVLVETYTSEALGTEVALYGVDWSEDRLTAVFAYNNIHYSYIGDKVSPYEMKAFIETLSLENE